MLHASSSDPNSVNTFPVCLKVSSLVPSSLSPRFAHNHRSVTRETNTCGGLRMQDRPEAHSTAPLPTSNVGPFGDDYPYKNHDSSEGEQ